MSARWLCIALAGGAALLGACEKQEAIEMLSPPATPSATLQKYWVIPDFALTERSGQPLRSRDLAGKVWVADFVYTTCPGPCPVLTGHLGEVQAAIGPSPDFRLVSISVDPEKDTPEVLRAYAERFQAKEGWYFCTGDKAAIYALAHDGFKLPIAGGASESGSLTHATRFILVDRAGLVRGFYEGTSAEALRDIVRDIRRLLDEK